MAKSSTHWFRASVCATLSLATTSMLGQASAATESGKAEDASASTDAPITKAQCLEMHRDVQKVQNGGKLVHARELARSCTNPVCPGLVVTDCARWLSDLDQRIPSISFDVRVDGKPNLDATVIFDGKPLEAWTRGESLQVDPGKHQFRFELAPHEPIVQEVLLTEGMRYRVVSADFDTKNEAGPIATTRANSNDKLDSGVPASTATQRPTPVMVYPLLGLGAVGAGMFAAFALLGKSKQDELDGQCTPNCTDSELKPMKTMYLVGDISLGVGAAALLTAGVLYLTRPERPIAAAVGYYPMRGGGATVATFRF